MCGLCVVYLYGINLLRTFVSNEHLFINLINTIMKKTLLTVCALVLSSLGVRAQWSAPEIPITTDHIPNSALFYHVGQQMFIYAGTTWGTRVSLTDDPSEAFLYEIEDQGDNVYQLYCASAAQTGYMGRSTEIDIYTDTKTSNWSAWGVNWTFEKVGDYYRILTAPSDPAYGSEKYDEDSETNYGLYQMGWDPNNIDVDQSGNSLDTNFGVFMLDPAATDLGYELDWAFVDGEDYELYVARYSLYASLMNGIEVGVPESDMSSYGEMLNSTDVDAINAATEELDQLILDYSLNVASPDNPQDVTSLITNPTFDGTVSTEPEGWIDTYGNMLIQLNKAYGLWDEELGAESTEYGLNVFSQNWRSETDVPIDASDIHQVLADLPQGRYYVIADCVATTGSATDPVSGCSLYAISNGVTYSTPVGEGFTTTTEGSGYPRRYTVNVIHFGGDLTIGYGYVPGWVRWFAVDNFQLYYAGSVEGAGIEALTISISNAQVYVDEYDYTYIYSEDTYNTLVAEIEKANEIAFQAVEDDCLEEVNVLNDLIDLVKAEITAYTNLQALYEQVADDMAKYDTSLPELSEMLSDMQQEYQDAWEDKIATVEQIETWISEYDGFVAAYVKDAMKDATAENPIEITALASNMDYADNATDGWTVTTGSAGNSGSFAVDFHTAEVWSNTFACLQTLEDMPAGQYMLKAKAFYRTSSNEETYNDYINGAGEILTFLTVESSKAPVVNQAAGAQTADEAPYTGYAETYEGSGIYVPNTMQSAEYAFNLDDTYACEVSGYLMEDGTLTFGIRNDDLTDGNAWSIWTQFQLFYSGESTEAALAELQALIEEAMALDDQVGTLIAAADEKLNNAIIAADELDASATNDEIIAARDALLEAIDYANAGIDLVSEVMEMVEIYTEMIDVVESSDTAFPELLEEINEAVGNEEFESNEQMQAWLDEMPAMWTAYVQYDGLETASVDNPFDITAVITNPSFDQGTNDNTGATGWTIAYEGDHVGIANTSQQAASDYAFEFWKVSSCDIHQTIVGLAEGYYHLTVQSLFRAGSAGGNDVLASYMESEDNDRFVMFYGNTAGVPVWNVYDYAQTEATEVDGEVSATYDGVTYYAPNTMQSAYGYFQLGYYLNEFDVYVAEGEDLTIGLRLDPTTGDSNWCVWDNFTISYLGTEAPDAVKSITADETTGTMDNAAIYDLSGRKVAKAQKGIYIVNGKKMVIK